MKILVLVLVLSGMAIACMGIASGACLETGRVGYGVFYGEIAQMKKRGVS